MNKCCWECDYLEQGQFFGCTEYCCQKTKELWPFGEMEVIVSSFLEKDFVENTLKTERPNWCPKINKIKEL